jgi:hypothetical protein
LLSAADSVGLFYCTEMADSVHEFFILIIFLHPVFKEGQIEKGDSGDDRNFIKNMGYVLQVIVATNRFKKLRVAMICRLFPLKKIRIK